MHIGRYAPLSQYVIKLLKASINLKTLDCTGYCSKSFMEALADLSRTLKISKLSFVGSRVSFRDALTTARRHDIREIVFKSFRDRRKPPEDVNPVKSILNVSAKVQKVVVEGRMPLEADTFSNIHQANKSLREITLKHTANLAKGSRFVSDIAMHGQLEKVRLLMRNLSPECIEELLTRNPKLYSLNIQDLKPTTELLAVLERAGAGLTELNAPEVETEDELDAIAGLGLKLSHISIPTREGYSIDASHYENALEKFSTCTSIDLYRAELSDQCYVTLAGGDATKIFLRKVDTTDEQLQSLVTDKLTHLDISETEVTSGSVATIGDQCPELEYLSIDPEHLRDYDQVRNLLENCPKLASIRIAHRKSTGDYYSGEEEVQVSPTEDCQLARSHINKACEELGRDLVRVIG